MGECSYYRATEHLTTSDRGSDRCHALISMEIDQTPIIRDRFHRRSAIYQLERPSCRVGIVPTEE